MRPVCVVYYRYVIIVVSRADALSRVALSRDCERRSYLFSSLLKIFLACQRGRESRCFTRRSSRPSRGGSEIEAKLKWRREYERLCLPPCRLAEKEARRIESLSFCFSSSNRARIFSLFLTRERLYSSLLRDVNFFLLCRSPMAKSSSSLVAPSLSHSKCSTFVPRVLLKNENCH